MKRSAVIIVILFVAFLAIQSVRDPNFWSTPNQRGDALIRKHHYKEAAKTYTDPWHSGIALYRGGDFEAAAKIFARVPGATGAFDQGNAWLMHGAYEQAIASYDRALGFRPGWIEAEENKAIAIARKAAIEGAGKDRDQESADAYKPDEIKFDQKNDHTTQQDKPPEDLAEQDVTDEQLRATWLRRVSTTPADFLRTKFAYQASRENQERSNP